MTATRVFLVSYGLIASQFVGDFHAALQKSALRLSLRQKFNEVVKYISLSFKYETTGSWWAKKKKKEGAA